MLCVYLSSISDLRIDSASLVIKTTPEKIYKAFTQQSACFIMTTDLAPEKGGTLVTFIADQVPEGITQEDHIKGMESSIENLEHYMAAKS